MENKFIDPASGFIREMNAEEQKLYDAYVKYIEAKEELHKAEMNYNAYLNGHH